MKKYDAIILCGGKGNRIKKITKELPKCLINFNGKPFLFHQLHYLKNNDLKNVILSVNYKAEQIENYVKNNINFINVKIVNDGKNFLGTGGAIKKSINLLKDFFYVIYGDSYLNFRLKNLMSHDKISTMAIYKNKNKYDKSNVEIKKSNYIVYDKSKKINNFDYIDYGASYLEKKILKIIKKTLDLIYQTYYKKYQKTINLRDMLLKKDFMK